jgi:hypothetical protein
VQAVSRALHRFLANTKADRHWPLAGVTEADETALPESEGVASELPWVALGFRWWPDRFAGIAAEIGSRHSQTR